MHTPFFLSDTAHYTILLSCIYFNQQNICPTGNVTYSIVSRRDATSLVHSPSAVHVS